MQDYTIVGLYYDSKQVWIGHVEAKNVMDAVAEARKEMEACSSYGAVLAAFEGKHVDQYGKDELIEDCYNS